MIDKESVKSLIEDCETQLQHCKQGITNYPEKSDDRDSFYDKISYYKFMIKRLQTFL